MFVSPPPRSWDLGFVKKSGEYTMLVSATGTPIQFATSNVSALTTSVSNQSLTVRMTINENGHVLPGANGTQNLGSTTLRWSTVFTSDLDLNNGVGDWTIVEGEDDLFIYNNKRGKVYKFKLEEVDPSTATPKKDN